MSTDRCCERCTGGASEDGPGDGRDGAGRDDKTGGGEKRADGLLAELRRRPTCSVDLAAKALCIGRSTAYAAARDGSLPTIRISNRILVPTAKLLALLGLEEAAA